MRHLDRPIAPLALACLALLTLLLGGVSTYAVYLESSESGIARHATEYSSLVDALGSHDRDSVDAPLHDQHQALPLAQLSQQAKALAAHLRGHHRGRLQDRVAALASQLDAVALRADQLDGHVLSFPEELSTLLGVNDGLPRGIDRVGDLHGRLNRLLPGTGDLARRLAEYERRFIVPRGRLDAVVTRAVAACRAQTKRHLELPPQERLDIEYVADRPWSGYTLYHGGFRSTMQVNRGFPLSVDQILNLACHEGYPGHHVYNVIRDRNLVRGRGWLEAAVLPVFSPEGFRAEALASAAAALAFSREERISLFQNELFPAAGHDGAEAERYVDVREVVESLASELGAVVRSYLEGRIDRGEAAASLRQRALMEDTDATLTFVDRYRGYALAYTYGRDWLQPHLGAHVPDRWNNLARLIVALPEPGR